MPMTADQSQAQTATLVDLGAIFVSLELSKSTWLVTAEFETQLAQQAA
ncbi:hypothetical protein [Neorhizobium sp. DT-125]